MKEMKLSKMLTNLEEGLKWSEFSYGRCSLALFWSYCLRPNLARGAGSQEIFRCRVRSWSFGNPWPRKTNKRCGAQNPTLAPPFLLLWTLLSYVFHRSRGIVSTGTETCWKQVLFKLKLVKKKLKRWHQRESCLKFLVNQIWSNILQES